MAYTEKRAYLELHLAVFLWGFTAILGDLIQLSALTLVWWRVFLTSLSLIFFVRIGKMIREVGLQRFLLLAGIGIIVGLHWVTFYGAIKLANASIALVCMATTSLFSSLLEPLIVRRPFVWYELLLGVFILPGIWLIVDGVDASMNIGIAVGLLSAALVSTFTSLNKKYISSSNPARITFIELGSATLFLAPFLYSLGGDKFWPSPTDWVYLLVLVLLCTTLTFFLSLRALTRLSAFASNLTINLEPVYGIFLAYFILDDAQELSPNFYWGTLLILVAVFGYSAGTRVLRQRKLTAPTGR
jgi:drug/metabolite transporter (DMT)-like permease